MKFTRTRFVLLSWVALELFCVTFIYCYLPYAYNHTEISNFFFPIQREAAQLQRTKGLIPNWVTDEHGNCHHAPTIHDHHRHHPMGDGATAGSGKRLHPRWKPKRNTVSRLNIHYRSVQRFKASIETDFYEMKIKKIYIS